MSHEIDYILNTFGLSEREKCIYLAALELGTALQVPLAQKAKVKRTTLREMLPDLLSRGIVQHVVRGKRKYIVARDPRELTSDLAERAERTKEFLPLLLAFQNTSPEKPEVRYFDGIEGIKFVYDEILKPGEPTYSFLNIDNIHPDMVPWLVHDYVPRRMAKKITTYTILNSSEKKNEILPDLPYRHNCIVPAERFPFKMDIEVGGPYVAFIHYQKDHAPNAILIRSEAAATTLRSMYKMIAEKYS